MAEELTRLEYCQSRVEINRQVVWNKMNSMQVPMLKKLITWPGLITTAACILLICGVYFWVSRDDAYAPTIVSTNEEIAHPGVHNATLQLDNGKKITLDSIPYGRLANVENAIITIDGNKIFYEAAMGIQGSETHYNTLATDTGQTYELVLPDGTHAWLNTNTSIRYPVAFTGNERHVEIKGEVYFEVAKDPAHPFSVSVIPNSTKIKNTEIKVLGTHFNVNAYGDEGTIKTTLIEGQIMVLLENKQQAIKPGQQAITSDKLKITDNIDTTQIVAWKNGNFKFDNCDLRTVMNQIARWYNVKIEYPAQIRKELFWGTVPRDMQIKDVLTALDSISTLQFEIKDRKVIIK